MDSNNNLEDDMDNYNYSLNYRLSSLNGINEEYVLQQEEQPKIEIKKNQQISVKQRLINEIDWDFQDQSNQMDELDFNQNDNIRNYDQEESILDDPESFIEQSQKTTEEIQKQKKRRSPPQAIQRIEVCPTNILKIEKKIKKQQNQQVETKNLPNYYGRHILNRIKRKLQDEQDANIKTEIKNKIDRLNRKTIQFTLESLRDILDEEYFREEAIKYLTSFDFLDDLLQSDKQQDIRPQIKYVKRMYEGCYNRDKLLQWKDS